MAIRDRNPAEVQVVAPVSTAQSPPRQIARDAQPGAGREGVGRYPKLEAVVWAQEEPRNMGARKFVLPKLRDIVPSAVPIVDVSRPERSSPARAPTPHIERSRHASSRRRWSDQRARLNSRSRIRGGGASWGTTSPRS